MKRGIFSALSVRIWAVVSALLIILVGVADYLALGMYKETVKVVLGGDRPVYDGSASEIYTSQDGIDSKEDSLNYANQVTETICEEGFVLLKNDEHALPLAEGTNIHVFGKNSADLVVSGSGSAAGDTSAAKTIYDSLSEAGFTYNEALRSFYEDDSASGKKRSDPSGFVDGEEVKMETAETPWESYSRESGLLDSITGKSEDAALIVISRMGGESYDLPKSSADDTDRHYLELDENEQELVRQVCSLGFQSVTLVVNSANTMELGFVEDGSLGQIDACIEIGRPGNNGIMALGRILNGSVNPSGHTVDTWTTDFTQDPSYSNFASLDTGYEGYYYTDYAEGIYNGYRYWETRAQEENETWYDEHVVYPFGYGLSYTSFEWELVDDGGLSEAESPEADGCYKIQVKVTNTGDCAGKDVVQLYASAPYTDGEIEKAYEVLCGFAKTGELQPGESETVTLEFEPYAIASYDYADANHNGFTGYELENGMYQLMVSRDAHTPVLNVEFQVQEKNEYDGIVYATNPYSGTDTTVENLFEDADDELGLGTEAEGHAMSRTDWELPTRSNEAAMSDGLLEKLQDTDSGNPLQSDGQAEMPATAQAVSTTLDDLHYDADGTLTDWVSFEDDRWDAVLDALTYDEMHDMYNEGSFKSNGITSIKKAQTLDSDGPTGYVNFMSMTGDYDNNCVYCCEVVVASTWNTEMAELLGEAIGEEGLQGNGNGTPYSGIYAPGLNLHRSPFGGRNGEYFSEDSYLSGYMGAAEIQGAQSRGVYMTMKHFAVNEQETYRQSSGLINWIDEQTLRELYLKPFEIAVTKGNATGVMTSFTRIGTKWCGGDYRLLTEVLKNEWGFHGIIISDYNVAATKYMNTKQEAYAGGNLSLASDDRIWTSASADNANDVAVLRENTKNVLYAVANSNARTAIGYKMPIWEIAVYAGEAVLALLLILWGILVIRKAKKKMAVQ